MQPYQEASEDHNRQSYRPFEAAATTAGIGFKSAIAGKVGTMLNKYVPKNLMMKGLSKIDPRLAKFMSLGEELGHSEEELKEYISGKISPNQSQESTDNAEALNKKTKNGQNNRNIVEQYSPELHQFIDQGIKKGQSPAQAAGLALYDKKGNFKNIIDKISKDHKANWLSIVEAIYGGAQSPNANQEGQPPQQPQQGQPSQPGKGEQAMLDILNKINQKLGQ